MPDRTAPIVGLALVVASIAGACGGPVQPPSPPTATPDVTPSPAAVATTIGPAPTADLTASPPGPASPAPTASPSPASSAPAAWFEDHFDAVLGWQAADARLLDATVEGGLYVLRPHPSSEPGYAWAPRDGAIGAASVEAGFVFPPGGRAMAGLAVADLDFALRLVLLLAPDGAWRLQRDDAAALRTLASGRAAAPAVGTATRLRLVLEDGAVIAWAGDQQLGRVSIDIAAGHAGLATQAPADGEQIRVDDFVVTLGT